MTPEIGIPVTSPSRALVGRPSSKKRAGIGRPIAPTFMSLESQAVPHTRPAVRVSDRAWDLLALLLLSGGLLLFAVGRASLSSLAGGTYKEPVGVSWVSRAEHHDSQTRWGTWLIAAGVMVGTVAAGRHALNRRRAAR